MEERKTYHTLDELYISPFTLIRKFDDNGQPYYVSLERQQHPTGIFTADLLLQSFSRGDSVLSHIARRLGCSGRDLSGLIRCLSGMPSDDFRVKYRQRLVDDLLRFTSLSLHDVACLSGIGTAHNLHTFTRRHYQQTPDERRRQIRRLGDEGRFSV